jgi:hypothetical protein
LKVNLDVPQMMRCLLNHYQPIVFVNSRKHLRKGLITYYKISGITCLQKHLDANHSAIYKRFQEEINNQRKENVERQFTKKRSLISNSSISKSFATKDPFKNDDVEQKMFMEDLTFLIVKSHLPL